MDGSLPAPLASLGPEAAALATRYISTVRLPPNTVVYYQEDPASTVYFVRAGHVRLTHVVEDGSVALYGILPSGSYFGEVGPFSDGGYCDTATTIDDVELAALDVRAVDGGRPEQLELRGRLAELLADRLRAHMDMTRALYMPSLSSRLALSLLRLLDTLGNTLTIRGEKVECLGPVVTQRDLGALARGTRENVNKTLRSWIKDGIVTIEDRHIIVKSRARLEAMAYGE